jgi:hypothetical protein
LRLLPALDYARRTVTLRRHPIEVTVSTPDGRELRLRVGIVPDSYIRERDLATVDLELFEGDRVLAAVNTLLSPRDDANARALAHEIVSGLGDGTLEPTAGALERLATRTH